MNKKLDLTLQDFPIGSYLYFFRRCSIQKNPYKRKIGEKRFFQDYAYSKLKITHHVISSQLVGVEGFNSNEGFDCEDFREDIGAFIVPEWLFLALRNQPYYVQRLTSRQKLMLLLNAWRRDLVELDDVVKTCSFQNPKMGLKLFYKHQIKN